MLDFFLHFSLWFSKLVTRRFERCFMLILLHKITRTRQQSKGIHEADHKQWRDLLIVLTWALSPRLRNTPLNWIDSEELLVRRLFIHMIFEVLIKPGTDVEASQTQRVATII